MTKNTYKVILKGAQNAKMQNIFQFGVLPSAIVLYLTKSTATYGNWKDIATFHHYDIQTIALFINGNERERERETERERERERDR